jgi:hypothetical protein
MYMTPLAWTPVVTVAGFVCRYGESDTGCR